MQHSKSRGKERSSPQLSDSELHQDLHLPHIAYSAKPSVLTHQAGTMADEHMVDETSPDDSETDRIQIAQAAIDYRIRHHQLLDMESIKALLRNFLNAIREPQIESSTYFEGLLSQWLDSWQGERNHALLIYVLGNGTDHFGDHNMDLTCLEIIDKIKTNNLEQRCIEKGACLHLAKMTSAVNTDLDDAFELKMAISLHDIRDLKGRLLTDGPVTVGRESIIQKSHMADR